MGFPKYDYPDGLLVFATWYYLAAVVCLIQHSLSLIGWTIYSRENDHFDTYGDVFHV